jgi:hypothetical protein
MAGNTEIVCVFSIHFSLCLNTVQRDMIGTNNVPSEKQNRQIRDLINHYREVLTEKSSASLDTTVLLDLKAQINDLEALISPARALIPELVATIFEFCVSSQGKLPTPSPHRAPLVLSQICASWRCIALSTPKVGAEILRHCISTKLTLGLAHSYGDRFFSVMTSISPLTEGPRCSVP